MFKPGQLIGPMNQHHFRFDCYRLEELDKVSNIWTSGAPHVLLGDSNVVMFVKLITREFPNVYKLHKMVIFHSERLWTSSDWLQTEEIKGGWKLKP